MNYLASASKPPIHKKIIWVVEFTPANEYQEDVGSGFIEECLLPIDFIIPGKHKKNILNIVRQVIMHDGKTLTYNEQIGK